ncbi:hypothetical protein CGMCC3_g13256 [Colletotrichum fructicola]|nr:uncharacterized protein CGMCC3_g13256 [Colletotrichum fructicola]KAE9570665.1 hypothetical protein CGMCC3_g13256 [Colletotrichum fructicola]
MATNFNRFAAGSTSYLLPWLALTAQLPYETGGIDSDILSVCVGLGSPMLMTISLMITILNKTWIHKAFRSLKSRHRVYLREDRGKMSERADAAVVIAEVAQQAPTRLKQTEQSLAREVFLDKHERWWKQARDYLESTRRGVTLSLVAQMSVAIIAWIFTAVGSLQTKVGNTEEALILSSGSLWIWLVPVIWGWILVGTQNKAETMQTALDDETGPDGYQPGIEVAGDFLADPPSSSVNAQDSVNGNEDSRRTPPNLWIFNVAGFQKQEGPAFNYARTLTWINFANNLLIAFEDAIRPHELISAGPQQPASQADSQSSPAGSQANPTHNNSTTSPPPHLYEYSNLEELSGAKPIFWKNVAFSILMGILVQWGTTMLAFILAFETVVKGLGCRSGGYLIYGILSTAACVSLLVSAALSHVAMREYEKERFEKPPENGFGLGAHICRALAVFLRLLGCFLLVANTVWLLLISIWELIGFFDSCYCASTELSKKEAGWILLFKGTDALKEDAQAAWGVGIGLGFVLIFLAGAVFYLASRHKHQ